MTQVEKNDAPDARDRSPQQVPSERSSLLFLDDNSLLRLDVASGRKTRLGAFPAPDVRASQDSGWIAYVVPGQPMSEAHPDFLADPRLRLFDAGSGGEVSLGRGFSPLWDPSGSKVAYLKSSPTRSCDGETCAGGVSVRMAWPGTDRSETVLEEGSYGLLGWAGNRLLVADASDTAHILSVAASGNELRLPLTPSQFWGASPDGRWMVRVGAKETAFVRLQDGRLTAETTPIPLGRRLLAAGAWASDSSGVAAVALGGRTAPEVVLFSPEDPELRPLPHSSGVSGAPLWSSDGDFLVFPRDSGGKNGALDASLCPTSASPSQSPKGGCRSLLSWREGVVLLRMEQ
ncbi:MAG: hypothetical protein M3346_10350 [Actinomycetota bacterium]|nr:hypothetical protein [Actinomycetota bacterium]